MKRYLPLLLLCCPPAGHAAAPPARGPAELIIHHARVVTLDAKSRVAQALAVRRGRIVAVGDNAAVLKLRGRDTRVLDAKGRTVLPGLYDSHVHPLGAATSELSAPLPDLRSIKEVLAHVRKRAAATPKGEWIVLHYTFPTRLDEARFPTKAELDGAAPDHPVLYHAGPAGLVNTQGLKVSGITRETPNPANGVIVKDPATGEPTGMLRNAYGVLKGLPRETEKFSAKQKRAALRKLFALYNEHGLTSVADRNASGEALGLYLEMQRRGELTVRVNVARSFNPYGTREEVARRLEGLPGKGGRGGPTGAGDDWVRIGPIKLFLDGGMLNGTAYMRQPWPRGATYQITEDHYRGLLFIPPAQLAKVVEEAARRRWQVTAHTAGEGAMDVLLDAYEQVNRLVPIKGRRYCITHANFPSRRNLERCKELGVCADVQPAWLYKDGETLRKVLGAKRVRWFQPYRSWLKYTVIGGGSDHMIRLDPLRSTNPWSPWLGIWVALTRSTERGKPLVPAEALTREQALRLYTVNSAHLHHEEGRKGTLEVGKLADFIVVDRDVLTCPVDEVRKVRVLKTVVGGKVVYERKE
jgi:predicted amidohydrolase YtcJ